MESVNIGELPPNVTGLNRGVRGVSLKVFAPLLNVGCLNAA